MKKLTPNQILAVVLSATAAVMLTHVLFNIYQAVCIGIIVAILAYSLILTLDDRKPPTAKF